MVEIIGGATRIERQARKQSKYTVAFVVTAFGSNALFVVSTYSYFSSRLKEDDAVDLIPTGVAAGTIIMVSSH